MQHLFRQTFADFVLELATVIQERGQALMARQGKQSFLSEQQAQGSTDRSPRRLHHVGDFEVQPTRAFSARRRDQAQRSSIDEKSSTHPGEAQESFHSAVWGCFKLPVPRNIIEVNT